MQVRTAENFFKIYHYVGEMFVEMEINAQNINDSGTKFFFQRSNMKSQSNKRTQIKITTIS